MQSLLTRVHGERPYLTAAKHVVDRYLASCMTVGTLSSSRRRRNCQRMRDQLTYEPMLVQVLDACRRENAALFDFGFPVWRRDRSSLHSNSGSNSGSDREKTLRAAPSGPSSAVMPTYARQNIVFERGEGSWLIATDGARYLDFASGVAVNALGHCHPHLVAALQQQAGALWHTSNLYRVAGQERLAERLVEASTFADRVFFCNSGAKPAKARSKPPASIIPPSTPTPSAGASSPSPALSTVARSQPCRRLATKPTSRASAIQPTASIM